MKLQKRDLYTLQQGISFLDGKEEPYIVTGDDGEKKTKTKAVPYKLSIKARYALQKNLSTCQKVARAVEEARKGKVEEYADKKGVLSKANQKKITQELEDLLNEEEDFRIHQVSFEDLRPEENGLPISVLTALDPMIRDIEDLDQIDEKEEADEA